MAARLLQRRFSSLLFRNQSLLEDSSWKFLASTRRNALICGVDGHIRREKREIQTQAELINKKADDEEDAKVENLLDHSSGTSGSSVKCKAFSSLKSSARHDLAMIFTCKVCETRSVKTMCRESYEKGVVVARCGGCNNLHLIADHLGWFGEAGSVEDLLAARGEEVKKGSVDTLNLTLEDLAGIKTND